MSTITATQVMSHPTAAPRRDSARTASVTGGVARGSVRLTRRGRLVVLLLGLAMAFGAFVVFGAGSVATERPGTPEPTRVVQVAPGDTLWDIAADAAAVTGEDVRTMVVRIQRLNALESGTVLAGQRLRVPTE